MVHPLGLGFFITTHTHVLYYDVSPQRSGRKFGKKFQRGLQCAYQSKGAHGHGHLNQILLAIIKKGCHGPSQEMRKMLEILACSEASHQPINPHCNPSVGRLMPFIKTMWQMKYPIMAIDYFTKWLEANALASITAKDVCKFTEHCHVLWHTVGDDTWQCVTVWHSQS